MINNITILAPGDEAAGAMGHVEGPGRVGKPDGGHHSDEGGHPSFQGKLHLSFVRVPRRK